MRAVQLNDRSYDGGSHPFNGVSRLGASHVDVGGQRCLGEGFTICSNMVILMTMSTMPLAEVKAHLSEVVSRVNGQHERVTVTVHGQASAVIMAPDDLERLEETIAVLADGALIRQLTDAETDLAVGRVEDLDALAAAMRARSAGT